MEDLKDLRRQLKENPESRELNNRYAQACLDIAKEYTVTSQGHIFICSHSDLEAVRYVMAKIPNASLLDGKTLQEYKRLERAVTQARINRGKPGSKNGHLLCPHPFYSDAFHGGTSPSAMGTHRAWLRPHPRPESSYLPDSCRSHTAALLWVGWLVERSPAGNITL